MKKTTTEEGELVFLTSRSCNNKKKESCNFFKELAKNGVEERNDEK